MRFRFPALIAGFFLLAAVRATSAQPPNSTASPADFFVATYGHDDWSGRFPAPNLGKTDGPFATLGRARDAVRQSQERRPPKDVVVLIRGGVYRLNETVVFGPEDSGVGERTVTYAAYPNEKPIFSSAAPIEGWKKLDSAPATMPESATGNVWVADLPQSRGGQWRFFSLYDSAGRLPRARSAGFLPAEERSYRNNETLYFPPGALRNWPNLEDVEIVIRPSHVWILNFLPLASVDEQARKAQVGIPGTYALRRQRFKLHNLTESCWVENVLEGLDEPGEWVLNSREGKLYLWPRSPLSDAEILAPRLQELIRVEGLVDPSGPQDTPVRNLRFRGLTFTQGDRDLWTENDAGLQHDWEMLDKNNALVRLRGAEHCAIEECHFANSGGTALRIDLHGQKNRVVGNHIEHMGGTGILLCGYGPGTKDVNKGTTSIICSDPHHRSRPSARTGGNATP